MRKLLVILLATLLVAPVEMASAQNMSKALKKEYKTKMKQLKKEKWELYGSSRTLDVTLAKFYEAMDANPNVREIMGNAARFKSKTVGHQSAINDACRTYAQQCGSIVKGRVDSDLASDGEDVGSEFDHFYAAYERLVEKEIQGELQEKFSLIRQIDTEKGDPVYEMQTYFLVDEDAASKARIRAYEQAMKESEAAQKMATKIGDFVKAGFE
jgi:DNA-binding ferritin-like protein (Dps family)